MRERIPEGTTESKASAACSQKRAKRSPFLPVCRNTSGGRQTLDSTERRFHADPGEYVRKIIPAFGVVLLCTLLASGESYRASPPFAWWKQWTLRTSDDATVEPAGQWLVLLFLDPECPVANTYLPVANALVERFADKGVQFVGVYADATLTPDRVRAHAKDFAIRFPVVRDPQHRAVRFSGVTYSSEVAVSNGDGQILYRGRIDNRVSVDGNKRPKATQHDLAAVLDRIVAGEPGPFANQPGFGCLLSEAGLCR